MKKNSNRESPPQKAKRAEQVLKLLRDEFPEATCALHHDGPFQLLIATILSAQCTDARVNMVTPQLFAAVPDAKAMVKLGEEKIREFIKSINFFNNKARNIFEASKCLVRTYKGDVPRSMNELTQLPGVGRKTANVVLGNAFDVPGIVVDTHVLRLSNRLDFAESMDAVKVEAQLEKVFKKEDWIDSSHLLILHGRKTCKALNPRCKECVIRSYCPSRDLVTRPRK